MNKKFLVSSNLISYLVLFAVLIFAFTLGPFHQLQGFELVPGDLGDARLNNYFLENIYLFFTGKSESLIHLSFFSPFPYVLGFSDNLFGAWPIYLFFRNVIGEPDTAFQYWFYLGYISNYFAAYFGLRLLKVSPIAAIFGAVIFSFALPVDAQMNHAQLGYRFAVPFAIAYFYQYLETANTQKLVYSAFWLVWVFYCSIYIGAFTLFFLGLLLIPFLFINKIRKNNVFDIFRKEWKDISIKNWVIYGAVFVALILLMLVLLYPYLMASSLYGFKRSYTDVLPMIPEMKSYFIADFSLLWGEKSRGMEIPIRWEHQLFIGFIPLALLITSVLIGGVRRQMIYLVFFGALILSVFLTIKFGDKQFSAWYLFSKLPLFNSIRAIGRIILVLLFPVALLCSLTIDSFLQKKSYFYNGIVILLFAGLLTEIVAVSTFSAMPKSEWRTRLVNQELIYPKEVAQDSILFFAQKSGDTPWAAELDAMWISLIHSKATLNGYSGNFPLGFQMDFGSNCSEVPRRIVSYLSFVGKLDQQHYQELIKRVKPVGFTNCPDDWPSTLPQISTSREPYSADIVKQLSIEFLKKSKFDSHWQLSLVINNHGNESISASSSSGNPISLSYRFLDKAGNPMSNWDPRIPLWSDIPAHGTEHLVFDIPNPPKSGFIEFSLVQEGIFWGHDLGVIPKKVVLGGMDDPKLKN